MKGATTIWLTGLSGAGKTTIAKNLTENYDLFKDFLVVDGDALRKGVCKDLGYSNSDREKNVERAAHICKLLNEQDKYVIACIMSPLEKHRMMAKNIVPNMFMAYVSCGMDKLKKRDPKGLYRKYSNGEITGMSGLDLPFEEPNEVNAIIDTEFHTIEGSCYLLEKEWKQWMKEKLLGL